MMCKIVCALLLVATVEARFLGIHGNYQLQMVAVAIPLERVLQDQLSQMDFAYPILAGTVTTFVNVVGNSLGPWAHMASGNNDIVRTSFIANSRGTNALSDDIPVLPIANLVGAALVDSVSPAAAATPKSTAGPIRMKRKNFLRYRNGEFRPTLCTPTLCLSERPYDVHKSMLDRLFWVN